MGDIKNFKGANNTIVVKDAHGKIVDNIAGAPLPPVSNVTVVSIKDLAALQTLPNLEYIIRDPRTGTVYSAFLAEDENFVGPVTADGNGDYQFIITTTTIYGTVSTEEVLAYLPEDAIAMIMEENGVSFSQVDRKDLILGFEPIIDVPAVDRAVSNLGTHNLVKNLTKISESADISTIERLDTAAELGIFYMAASKSEEIAVLGEAIRGIMTHPELTDVDVASVAWVRGSRVLSVNQIVAVLAAGVPREQVILPVLDTREVFSV